eukprot:NODE_342_length_2379_cov_4.006217_g320_i0.p1 GENE.NODE_342_length_2379_cov_4.006217_g320_i0~~NODE_342_length_2379_cov_4.006217_g320_i0.p1  ORF type:complete len:776 (+),score=282.46 NODE_342_length_2379_cov_4.006217_g320_i0:2-2329(+)
MGTFEGQACYDESYRDIAGKQPGQEGFVSPFLNRALEAGGYDGHYCDKNGLRAGECGFLPPICGVSERRRQKKLLGLGHGYDEDYYDDQGCRVGEAHFVPPCYFGDYVDVNGKRVGEAGFLPPGQQTGMGLPLGGYTEQYRDENGRRAGDLGFLPPLASLEKRSVAQLVVECPEGYDGGYHDCEGRTNHDPDFQPPHPTGAHSAYRWVSKETAHAPTTAPDLVQSGLVRRILQQLRLIKKEVLECERQATRVEAEKKDGLDRLRAVKAEQLRITEQFALYQASTEQQHLSLEAHNAQLVAEIADLKQEVDTRQQGLLQELEEGHQRVHQLTRELMYATEEAAQAKGLLSQKEHELMADLHGAHALRDELESLTDGFQQMKDVNERQAAMIRSQTHTMEQETGKLRAHYERRVAALEGTRVELVGQIARLQEEDRVRHQNHTRELSELEEGNRQKDFCLEKCALELSVLKEVAGELGRHLNAADTHHTHLAQLLRSSRQDFEKEAEATQGELARVSGEHATLLRQLHQMQDQQKDETMGLKRLQEEVHQLRAAKEIQDTEMMNLRIQKDVAQERLQAALATMEEERQLQLLGHESQSAALRKEVDTQKQLNSQLQSSLETLKTQRKSLQDENAQLNHSLCHTRNEHTEAHKQLKQETQRLQVEVKRLATTTHHKDTELQHLQSKLKYQTQQITEQLSIIKLLQNGSANRHNSPAVRHSERIITPTRAGTPSNHSSTGTPPSLASDSNDRRSSPSSITTLRSDTHHTHMAFISPRLP